MCKCFSIDTTKWRDMDGGVGGLMVFEGCRK